MNVDREFGTTDKTNQQNARTQSDERKTIELDREPINFTNNIEL